MNESSRYYANYGQAIPGEFFSVNLQNHRQILFMNIGVSILKKILANSIQKNIKSAIHQNQAAYFVEMQE